MPISSAQLRAQLERITAFERADIQRTMHDAHYGPDADLDGIYVALLVAKATRPELARFFRAAGARHPVYGGDDDGYIVHPDHYPTGHDNPPCVEKDNYNCWARPRPW